MMQLPPLSTRACTATARPDFVAPPAQVQQPQRGPNRPPTRRGCGKEDCSLARRPGTSLPASSVTLTEHSDDGGIKAASNPAPPDPAIDRPMPHPPTTVPPPLCGTSNRVRM
ncbi:hypothetical protein RJ55_06235 [Drechmeria coniospora]|nr:hypothetical protein RJ55_06235 [Drechmeria coniospora]